MSTIRNKIMQEAAKLFSTKGFLTTSVQDIITQCQISKGSFYNYFKSKEELAFHLFKQKKEQLREEIRQFEKIEELTEKERFAAQLETYCRHTYQNREMLQMMFPYLDQEKKLTHYLTKAQLQDLHWMSQQLIRIYGKNMEPFAIDCAALLFGILFSFALRILICDTPKDRKEIDIQNFIQYALRRMDVMVTSFQKEEKPLFTKQMLIDSLQEEKQETLHYYQQVKSVIVKLRLQLQQIELDQHQLEEISGCLDALENEFSSIQQKPKEYICEGLLLYLAKQKIPGFEHGLQQLTKLIHLRT